MTDDVGQPVRQKTVPLMFLAGFLGAVAGTLLPQDLILGLGFSLFALALIAIVVYYVNGQ